MLALIRNGASKLPVLRGVLLEAADGAVTAAASDYLTTGRGTVAAEVTEPGRVLVDAEDRRAIEAEPLLRLALRELGVDATNGGLPQVAAARECRRADAIMMLLVNVLAQRFRAVPARSDAGQGLHKTAVAHPALIAPASHPQPRPWARTARTRSRCMPR